MSDKYTARNPEGLYFITCTVVDWINVFTRPEYKLEIVKSLEYCQAQKGLQIFAWCLMPSHLHLIAAARAPHTLPVIMRDFKKFTSRRILEMMEQEPESRRNWMLDRFRFAGRLLQRITSYHFWQDGYHAVELTSNKLQQQKLDYLHRNPVTDLTVAEPEHYVFSSASNYAGSGGLLKVEMIQ